ncbi:MAG: AMP-binding protein, partial [Deltaproteobacteria bacterium]|nr:AMP-binding protein [Deltaproteobacteria bacterium]
MTGLANIAAALSARAVEAPDALALHVPVGREPDGRRRYVAYDYRTLDGESDRLARGLDAVGVGKGVRVALMVPPGFEFFALVFALFKAGAVPVMLDPGIGRHHLKACLAEAEPAAFIGVPKAHLARVVLGWAKASVRTLVTVGRRYLWGGHTLESLREAAERAGSGPFLAATAPDDVAAILFTSGSTGTPKGVVYRHRHFVEQVALIRATYGIEPGEIDLPTFPLFGLFDPALGMTTVVPDMDFTRPARLDPAHFLEVAQRFGATSCFGSPAVLDTLSRHGVAVGATSGAPLLGTLRRVISAGAPVPGAVLERMRALLPEATRIHTPYGATECLPIATIACDTILGETWAKTRDGAGVCVGLPLAANDVRVIRIDDGPIGAWSDELEVPRGTVGEVTVLGPTTTDAYFRRDEATRLAKIDHGGRARHRMGDLGYLDEAGRLWFCGRKVHRVRTAQGELYTAQVEGVFDAHSEVRRSALVGIGPKERARPVVWIEREPHARTAWPKLEEELRDLGAKHAHTRALDTF